VKRCRQLTLVVAIVHVFAISPAFAEEDVDLSVVHRIKHEAFRNSQAMNHMLNLSDRFGPRVTGSPAYRAAAEWARDLLSSWDLAEPALESWGEFGRGWSLERYSAHMVKPIYAHLPGIPGAWVGATPGSVTAPVVAAHLYETVEEENAVQWDLDKLAASMRAYAKKYKGQLKGKIVLLDRPRELELADEPEGNRLDESALSEEAQAPKPLSALPYEWPLRSLPSNEKKRNSLLAWLPLEVSRDYWEQTTKVWDILYAFFRDEGVTAVLHTDERGSGGIAFTEEWGDWAPGAPIPPPIVALSPEHYSRISRLVENEIPVELELDIQTSFHETDLNGYNVVAEIPGRSKKKKSEVVMLGGHLDSWHGATGATDNAAGCAVVLEAVRILKALDLPMDRTVRLALWGGEEQGLYGSGGYVRKHFADPLTMKLEEEHAKLSGYFNFDNGSGKIRGVYLQGNDMMRPIFEAWLAPFKDLGVTTISIRNTGGTDHLSFDAVGLPGFQFIQDPLEYSTRTHHSDLDDVAHVVEADLMQASAIVASLIYHAANRDDLLPRKPLPDPPPPRRDAP
jgi:carboxypeptidase Q